MPWIYEGGDGTKVIVPDGVTENDTTQIDALLASARAAKVQSATPPAAPEQSFVDRAYAAASDMATGVVRGAAPIVGGAAIGAAAGAPFGGVGAIPGAVRGAGLMAGVQLVGDPAAQIINSIAGEQIVRGPTEVIGDVLDNIGLPRPETAAGRMAQATAQGVAGAGGMMAVGKTISRAASPVLQAVGEGMMANAPAQIGGGAGGGFASQGAAELGAGPLGQIGAGLVGGLAGAKGVGKAFAEPMPVDPATGMRLAPATAQRVEAMRQAEQRGIPVRTTDVFPPDTYFGKWAKTVIEKMPFTTARMNAQQAAARQAAVDDFLTSAGARGDMNQSLGKATENLLKNRQMELSTNLANKADVMTRANVGTVDVSRTIAEIDRQIAKLQAMRNVEMDPAIAQLENVKKSLAGQTLDMVEANRQNLGNKLKDPSIGPVVKNNLQKAVGPIYAELNKDMRAHIAGALDEASANKWAVANKRLANMLDEVDAAKSRDILAIVRRGNADPAKLKKVLFGGTESDLRTAYKYMDGEGRAAARRAYIDKAVDVATGGRGLNGADPVSVDKFKNALQTAIKNSGPFFAGDEGLQARGLIRALDLTAAGPRANQLAQTGAMNTPAIIGTALGGLGAGAEGLTGAIKAAGAISAAAIAARAYESPAMRNALIRLAKTKPGSESEYGAVNRFMVQLAVESKKEEANRKAKK